MALQKITQVTGRAIPVLGDDIDTDRIIPARFMKCVSFDGLGKFAFHDVRHDEAGNPTPHTLNDARFAGATILLSGSNFGCGSSREHAPQALYHYGFRAIVAESFAEIFFGNSTTLGIPCVIASRDDIAAMAALVEADPAVLLTLDLVEGKISVADTDFPVSIPSHAREAFVQGRWDAIASLLENEAKVRELAAQLA